MTGRSAQATVAVAAMALAAWSLVACGSTAQRSATTSTTASPRKTPSKLPAEVTRTADRLKTGEKPGADASFTDSGVPVRDDGKLQLELHSSGPISDARKAELTALGADIVAAGSAVGVVDAWVPFARVEEVAALAWVDAVTVPSPTRAP